mmetsp:Transcript_5423/g.11513  ORF Transcript_5423/g.11513 Transcript_5423/m.11513 type:complete len:84 (+) Transcript_5423:2021-2272(+)
MNQSSPIKSIAQKLWFCDQQQFPPTQKVRAKEGRKRRKEQKENGGKCDAGILSRDVEHLLARNTQAGEQLTHVHGDPHELLVG